MHRLTVCRRNLRVPLVFLVAGRDHLLLPTIGVSLCEMISSQSRTGLCERQHHSLASTFQFKLGRLITRPTSGPKRTTDQGILRHPNTGGESRLWRLPLAPLRWDAFWLLVVDGN